MRRIRIEHKPKRHRDDRSPSSLPFDPRDPDILRAKRLAPSASRSKERV
jgi:hypothetical protein